MRKACIGDTVKVEINGKTFEFRVAGVEDDELVLQAPKGRAKWRLVLTQPASDEEEQTVDINIRQVDAQGRYLLQEEF